VDKNPGIEALYEMADLDVTSGYDLATPLDSAILKGGEAGEQYLMIHDVYDSDTGLFLTNYVMVMADDVSRNILHILDCYISGDSYTGEIRTPHLKTEDYKISHTTTVLNTVPEDDRTDYLPYFIAMAGVSVISLAIVVYTKRKEK
jgi:hypothetical protein